ncbi:MAG: hypothetical protein J6J42_07500 [Lachnospiraceae bacterium]|nr:hypothetical protein [Lachnospiraceae bacterium]MBP3610162.1 hypothetical protein [Lachnospiraceae bacterium]
MKYLVKITPLEPYSFGNDQNFVYPEEASTGKESYFVRSKEIPEQTTILGLLRYLVLKEYGLLRTDFQYTPEERRQMKHCIGSRSFSYLEKEKQEFGDIHEISPVFLLNDKEEILIRNPYHNKAERGYQPMQMEAGVETSNGSISLPKTGEYDTKKGYAGGFYNLATQEIEHGIFNTIVVSGNRKNEKQGSEEGCFFKRELKNLKKNYAFGVFADVEKLPEKAVGYMGKKKSAFLIETKEVDSMDLEAKVTACFADQEEVWFYALSDLVLSETPVYEEFCIVEEKYQRNLETVYEAGSRLKKLKKSEVRHHLIQSGSVFYKTCSLPLAQENCRQIGYNRVVQLGGR